MIHTNDHWRTEVRIGPHTVLASGFHALFGKRLKAGSSLLPKLGVYPDKDWENVVTDYPKQIVDWPDCGIIELPVLKSLVQLIKEKLKAGEIVEIGCYLGHGRAGTLLACLLVDVENLTPDIAISELRYRYCEYAVEYSEQVELVFRFASGINPDQFDSRTKGSLDIL